MQYMLLHVGCCRWNATIIIWYHQYWFCLQFSFFAALHLLHWEQYMHVHSASSSRSADNSLLGLCTWTISALYRHFATHNSKETAARLHALMVYNIHTGQVKVILDYTSRTLLAYGCHWTCVFSLHVLCTSWAVRTFCWPLSRHEPHIMSTGQE